MTQRKDFIPTARQMRDGLKDRDGEVKDEFLRLRTKLESEALRERAATTARTPADRPGP